jgi:hypothetical protein
MKIIFRYFWRDFLINRNVFLGLFGGLKIEGLRSIEIHSVFVKPRKFYSFIIYSRIRWSKLKDKLTKSRNLYIWYTGEVIDLPSKYDLTISFKPNSESNIYWPLWVTYIDYDNSNRKYDREFILNQQTLLKPREILIDENRQWRICAFISNEVSWRMDIVSKLKDLGCIDIYGGASGEKIESKLEIAKNYVFQFCFENIIEEGYVTEKPLEAWMCENIPIYAGGDILQYLNKGAMIDCSQVAIHEIPKYIFSEMNLLERNFSRINSPILKKQYDFKNINEKLILKANQKIQ